MKLKDGKSRLLGWRLISNFPPNGFLHPASSIHLLEQGTTAGLKVRQLCTIDNLKMLKMAISELDLYSSTEFGKTVEVVRLFCLKIRRK